jgi:hypothetical protein
MYRHHAPEIRDATTKRKWGDARRIVDEIKPSSACSHGDRQATE